MGGETGSILASLMGSLLLSRFGDKWTGLVLWWKPMHRPDVETLKELIAAGKLKPAIDRRMPLSEVAQALRYVEDGRASGKVVLIVDESLPRASM